MVKEEREKADQRVERFKRQNHRIMTGEWREACSVVPIWGSMLHLAKEHDVIQASWHGEESLDTRVVYDSSRDVRGADQVRQGPAAPQGLPAAHGFHAGDPSCL